MNRFHLVLLLSPAVLGAFAIAASCSTADEDPLKPGTGRYYQPKDGGDPDREAVLPEAGDLDVLRPAIEMPKEITTTAQAVQVLLTSYDLEVKEADFAKTHGNGPPIKAYAGDLIQDVKGSRGRLRGLIAAKDITPTRTGMTDRMKFESQASISHLSNIFPAMFNSVFANRRIDVANNMLRVIDSQIAPVMEEDDDLKKEITTVRAEIERRLDRAETVRSGQAAGTADGMFPTPEDPIPPQGPQQPQGPPAPQQPQEPATDAGP
ncbi:MAG: DUF4142 domain-containing protein [Labilithrix sp.]|nr:DUF4142 domain-containing protein [Labilithrix sp.]